jgi:hypothetical protein
MTEQRTKADEHWASRGLVAMLLREFKDFKAAAEIESGSSDVFSLCERDIAEKVAAVEKGKSVVAGLALQQVLDNARAEVEEHERWQKQVFKSFSKEDEEQGLTLPLRQSFAASAEAREMLLRLVNSVSSQYFQS